MKKLSTIAVLTCMGILAAGCAGKEVKPETGRQPKNGESTGTATDETTGAVKEIVTGEIAGEITVSCYESTLYQSFLEEAAKQFEQKYPGTKVNIDTFSAMPEMKSSDQDGQQIQTVSQKEDPQGRSDYISKTSTSLMSGQGADLLAMDVLPIYKYVEAGQLENINEYMEHDPDFQMTDYRENILDALKLKDGIWFLPLNYSFDYYAYDSTLSGAGQQEYGPDKAFSTRQLMELGKAEFDGVNKIFPAPAYLSGGNGDLFSQLFREQYISFVDMENKTANFSDGKFEELLNDVKALADAGYISRSVNQATDTSELLENAENPTERFMFKPKTQFALVSQTSPDPEFKVAVNTSEVGSGIEDDDQIAGICAENTGIVPFSYGQAFGINSNSGNKATSWAFLKFLLSYDVQKSPNMSFLSLPLHNQARTDKIGYLYSMMFAEGGEPDDSVKLAMKGYTDTVEIMSDQINGYTMKDTTIQDMVIKETAYFFDGTKTAGQVCEVLQNKIDLYLNE